MDEPEIYNPASFHDRIQTEVKILSYLDIKTKSNFYIVKLLIISDIKQLNKNINRTLEK
jgi:hypothetical protein